MKMQKMKNAISKFMNHSHISKDQNDKNIKFDKPGCPQYPSSPRKEPVGQADKGMNERGKWSLSN